MGQDRKRPKGADTIDANLRRVYLDALNEAVPDRFVALLDQLRAQDAATRDAAPAQTPQAQPTAPHPRAAPDGTPPESPASSKSAAKSAAKSAGHGQK